MCHTCLHEFMVIHSWKDKQDVCIHCESTGVTKLLTKPIKIGNKKEELVGQTTKEHIDANKEILKDLKQASSSETYEPS